MLNLKKLSQSIYNGLNPLDDGRGWTSAPPPMSQNQQAVAQTLSGATRGALADPIARQAFIQSTAPSHFNPVTAPVASAVTAPVRVAQGVYNQVLRPLPGAFINTAKVVPDVSSAGADLIRATLDPTEQNKRNLAFSQRALSNAYQGSIPNAMITPAWHATQALEQTKLGNPLWYGYNQLKQNQKNKQAAEADAQSQQAIYNIQKGVRAGQINPQEASNAISQISQYNQAMSQRKEYGYQKALVNAGFNPTDSAAAIGRKFVSNAGQTVANAATLGAAAEAAPAESALARVVTRANAAGKFMAVAAPLGELGQDKLNIKNIVASIPKGYAQGAVIGAVGNPGDLIGAGKEVAPRIAEGVKIPVPSEVRVNIGDQNILRDYSDMLVGANKARGGELSNLIDQTQQLGKKYGVDLTNGSKAERLDRATTILDQIGAKNRDLTASGAIKNPFYEGDTAQRPQAEQPFDSQEYIRSQSEAQKAAAKGDTNKLAKLKEQFRVKFVDALAPIEDPIIASQGRRAEVGLRNQLDRSLRADTLAGQFAKDNGLHDIIQGIKNPDAFNQYLIAKHAADLEANGIKTGRNSASDAALVQELGPQYEAQAQALTDYNHRLLDKTVDYGLISRETANYLKQKYPNYVPFDRIFTESEQAAQRGTGSGTASLSTQSVVQKIKGSGRQIQPPIESILSKTKDVVAQGERNLAAQELVKAKDLPGNPLGLRELAKDEAIGTKPTVSFLENGKQRVFETTPEVAAAAKSLNKEQMGFVGKIFAAPTRVLRLGATGANAAFALANVVKDTASAFINSEHSLRASAANPKVFLQALDASIRHGSEHYGELVREGAGGTSFDIARNAAPETVKRIRAERNVGTRALYTVRHPGELLRAVEDTIGRSEEFGRAVQYYGNKEAALREGRTPTEARAYAADAARNNTVNFARAGEYGRVLNTVLPYLNAGMQGSRTLLRNLKERPLQTGTKIVITAFIPVATATAWNLNDPERKKAYDNISEYEKQNNIIIVPLHPKQDKDGRWNVIKIPVSQEIANLNNIVRNGVEARMNDKGFNGAQLAGDLAGTTTSLNAQSPRQLVGQITPQAVKPFAETALNQNLFTGQQIVPDALKNLSPQDQVSSNTSGTARVIGRITNTSPLQIDNAIRTTTGGLGQNLVNASDTALNKVGVIPANQIGGKSLPTSIANRFNSAQGQTPGSQFFSTIQQEAKDQKLAGKDYTLLNSLISKEIDPSGKPIPQNEKDALNNNSILANNPRVAAVRASAAIKLANKLGKPIDPLYQLSPQQQQAYYKMNASIYKGQDYERVVKENKSWLPDFQQQRSDYYDKLNLPNPTVSGKVPYPLNDDQKKMVDQYFAISDPKQRSAVLAENPQIGSALDSLSKYGNDKRVAQGGAPLDTYPKASPAVQNIMNTYNALPKNDGPKGGNKTRSQWIATHPKEYAAMNQFYAQASLYSLEGEAVAAQYQDTGFTTKGLGDIYNLGQYDIGKETDANGNTFYALGGGGGSSGSTGSGGYGGSRSYARSGSGNSIEASYKAALADFRNPYKYAIARSAGGSAPKAKAAIKVGNLVKKVKVASGAGSKPKVSIKKALT